MLTEILQYIKNGIVIFNCHTSKLKHYKTFHREILDRLGCRKIKVLFFVPRNNMVSYVVIALE